MSPAFVNLTNAQFATNGVNALAMSPGQSNNITLRGMLSSHNSQQLEGGARLAILKGSVPTDFAFSTAGFNSRSSDALVIFDASPGTSSTHLNQFSASRTNVNPMVIETSYSNAIATGTATWFWWFTSQLSSTNTYNNNAMPFNQIIGTVGPLWSSADLKLPTVSIVSGEPYRIYSYRMLFPTIWTFGGSPVPVD